jgi:hypothetical protein
MHVDEGPHGFWERSCARCKAQESTVIVACLAGIDVPRGDWLLESRLAGEGLYTGEAQRGSFVRCQSKQSRVRGIPALKASFHGVM